MSVRNHASILGISHSYLSMMMNGKRPWNPDVKKRYEELVTTLVTTKNRVGEEKVVPRKGLEPPLSFEKRILSPPRCCSFKG